MLNSIVPTYGQRYQFDTEKDNESELQARREETVLNEGMYGNKTLPSVEIEHCVLFRKKENVVVVV